MPRRRPLRLLARRRLLLQPQRPRHTRTVCRICSRAIVRVALFDVCPRITHRAGSVLEQTPAAAPGSCCGTGCPAAPNGRRPRDGPNAFRRHARRVSSGSVEGYDARSTGPARPLRPRRSLHPQFIAARIGPRRGARRVTDRLTKGRTRGSSPARTRHVTKLRTSSPHVMRSGSGDHEFVHPRNRRDRTKDAGGLVLHTRGEIDLAG